MTPVPSWKPMDLRSSRLATRECHDCLGGCREANRAGLEVSTRIRYRRAPASQRSWSTGRGSSPADRATTMPRSSSLPGALVRPASRSIATVASRMRLTISTR